MNRDKSLETLRGLAALCVLLWHSALGFFPGLPEAAAGNPFFGVMNGTAAVAFFFVLSGFVLTRRYFVAADSDFLLRNAIKRWPRLAFPVTMVVLLSWALFRLGLYRYEDAAHFTQSPWLAKFANAYAGEPFGVGLRDALTQGLAMTFIRGDSYYDSSLWTMRFEFIGSFIAFGAAGLIGFRTAHAVKFFLVALILVIVHYAGQPWYAAFPVGVLLAAVLPSRTSGLRLPLWISIAGVACAGYLAGYLTIDRGAFHPMFALFGGPQQIYVWICASVILIASVSMNDQMRNFFSGQVGVFLGWISFPLYLVHVLIICSLGSAILLWMIPRVPPPYPNVAAVLVTIIVSVAAAVPLAMINDWWVKVLNRWLPALTKPAPAKESRHPAPIAVAAEAVERS